MTKREVCLELINRYRDVFLKLETFNSDSDCETLFIKAEVKQDIHDLCKIHHLIIGKLLENDTGYIAELELHGSSYLTL